MQLCIVRSADFAQSKGASPSVLGFISVTFWWADMKEPRPSHDVILSEVKAEKWAQRSRFERT